MENVMYGILNGFGIEQLLVAFAAGIVAALVKRKIKLDVKRELIVRLVVALGLAAILCAALKQNYGWLISTASGGIGLSYVLSGLSSKEKSLSAETFLQTVAPFLKAEDIRAAIKDKESTEEIYSALRPLTGNKMSDDQVKLISGVVSILKRFGY